MGKIHDQIDEKLAGWIGRQRLFFVASAPTEGGHVNVSPKGPIESLRILDGHTVEYDDHVGSGAETVAHLRENARICVMLCAFEGPPRIVRLHGRGDVAQVGTPRFDELAQAFELDGALADFRHGVRSIVRVEVERVADSCGYVVPLLEYVGEREQMPRWQRAQVAKLGEAGVLAYSADHNAASIDGLPGVEIELLPLRER